MNIREFRATLREQFDRANSGAIVEIERSGVKYYLCTHLPEKNNFVAKAKPEPTIIEDSQEYDEGWKEVSGFKPTTGEQPTPAVSRNLEDLMKSGLIKKGI